MEYLKIKDDVDLKELEKFGFELWGDVGYIGYDLYCGEYRRLAVLCSDRRIVLLSAFNEEPKQNSSGLVKLYDLTQAGLVEKVVG